MKTDKRNIKLYPEKRDFRLQGAWHFPPTPPHPTPRKRGRRGENYTSSSNSTGEKKRVGAREQPNGAENNMAGKSKGKATGKVKGGMQEATGDSQGAGKGKKKAPPSKGKTREAAEKGEGKAKARGKGKTKEAANKE